ncbi:MAG: aldehyde dehydrogenase family protein [Acidimicrobiia bacterium]
MNSSQIDSDLETLSQSKKKWATLPVAEKIDHLHELVELTVANAEDWADAGVVAKGIDPQSPLAGEEWISGPYALLGWLHATSATLAALDAAADVLEGLKTWEQPDGQAVARVYPTNIYETLLLHGYTVDVWMQPGVKREELSEQTAHFYRNPDHEGRVALVLGAGNISSIVPLDILYKMYADGEVVVVKMNPVNDYLGPIFERIFAPLIEAGFVRFAYGAGDVGAYLTGHDGVDTIHITGSSRTHDTIVFGAGEEGAQRKANNQPTIGKPITSELGCVSPTIIVPGPWTKADIAYQAEHLATQKLHNAGFNCNASQVLVLPADWEQGDELVDAVRDALAKAEERPAYYPGADKRHQTARDHYPDAEKLESNVDRTLIVGVDPTDASAYCFNEEFFAPIYATTRLDASTPAEFLREAVKFSNETLQGTLGANIIIHPRTAKELGDRLDKAIAELRYGTVAVNAWTGVGFLTGRAAWGAYPGHSLDDVQSGVGVVHNALLFDHPQKSVVKAPFRPFPRGVRHGRFYLSPRPPWFVTNDTAQTTAKRLTYYAGDGKLTRFPGIFVSALRG